MKHVLDFKLWENKLADPPKIIDMRRSSSTDVKKDLSSLFDFEGNGVDVIFYRVKDNEKYWVSYKPSNGDISLWQKVNYPLVSDPFIISKSPNVVHNASRIITATENGLSREASEWMEESLEDEPWEAAVKNAIMNGPVTSEDVKILGEDAHKYRGTIAAKRYNV